MVYGEKLRVFGGNFGVFDGKLCYLSSILGFPCLFVPAMFGHLGIFSHFRCLAKILMTRTSSRSRETVGIFALRLSFTVKLGGTSSFR